VSFAVYVGAVLFLAVLAYVVHRALIREPPDTACRRAAVLAGFVTGPVLLAVIVLVAVIRDCSFGTGC
jgi:NADH:ubiquinone oxidoreductase subunit 6 (subunit J)